MSRRSFLSEGEEMVNTPRTYSEWRQLFDMIKKRTNDAEVLQAMRSGTIEWQSGIADRFSQKLVDAINFRMNKAGDNFQKTMAHSGGEAGVIRALESLRKEYYFLCCAVDIPCLPEDIRKKYIGLIIDQANKTQESLENSSRQDRSGRLLYLIRQHRVNNF